MVDQDTGRLGGTGVRCIAKKSKWYMFKPHSKPVVRIGSNMYAYHLEAHRKFNIFSTVFYTINLNVFLLITGNSESLC